VPTEHLRRNPGCLPAGPRSQNPSLDERRRRRGLGRHDTQDCAAVDGTPLAHREPDVASTASRSPRAPHDWTSPGRDAGTLIKNHW